MSGHDPYDPNNSGYFYPGDPRYSKDLTDERQFELLRPRIGDVPPNRAGTNTPWGKRQLLQNTGPQASPRFTFVSTDILDRPVPWALEMRFSLDGVTWSAEVPASYPSPRGIEFTITRSLDQKSGPVTEVFELVAGDAQPFCSVIARALTVSATLTSDTPNVFTALWVQVVVCIVSNIDCERISPPVAPVPGFDVTGTTRWPAETAPTYVIGADPTRALFTIVNQSAANLYVHLGTGVNIAAGSEFATVVIPGNVSGGFSAENYRGVLTFRFDADDAAGYALTTVGSYS